MMEAIMKETELKETKKEWGLFVGKMGRSTMGNELAIRCKAKGHLFTRKEILM